ncbi:MAG: ankyrin repeat domain-containing protein, partial [Bdellovibrionaceae bacterium]|nr:ankyrin repeat domain-containing protein [Pseudobdellovibrionaceae bacterium]
HNSQYKSYNGYTRAYEELTLVELSKTATNTNYKITAGELNKPTWAPEELNAQNLFEEILQLQNSIDEKEQITFITQLSSLYETYEIKDPNIIKKYLTNKIKDKNLSFKLRKLAFFYLIKFLQKKDISLNYKDFSELLTHFSQKEEQTILRELSHWKKSSDKIKRNIIHDLTVSVFINQAITKFKNIIDINSKKGNMDSTVLMDLIEIGEIKAVNKILEEGVDIHALNKYGDTALHLAVLKGYNNIIKALINHGAKLNAKNNYGYTPLDRAWTIETYELLKNNGANNSSFFNTLTKKWNSF